jgi:3-oxoacyl-[acyl-carrier protein] reductase
MFEVSGLQTLSYYLLFPPLLLCRKSGGLRHNWKNQTDFIHYSLFFLTLNKKMISMDLKIEDKQFIVCGASSGFGRATAERLLQEKASVIAVARREQKLQELQDEFGNAVIPIAGDLHSEETHATIENTIDENSLHGLVLNAAGPPPGTPLEMNIDDWDEAYETVMRWKIDLALRLVPYFTKNNYGRLLFIESQSVKQPMPAMVLSNAFRSAVVSFAKSLSLEIARQGVTVNVLAPGSHNTPAINRVIKKNAEGSGQSFEKTKDQMKASVPVGRFGEGDEIASLAAWLLSSHAGYVTGQTISHDGGNVKGLFG